MILFNSIAYLSTKWNLVIYRIIEKYKYPLSFVWLYFGPLENNHLNCLYYSTNISNCNLLIVVPIMMLDVDNRKRLVPISGQKDFHFDFFRRDPNALVGYSHIFCQTSIFNHWTSLVVSKIINFNSVYYYSWSNH